MALYWSSLLMHHWLFTVCVIAHFGYNGATVCILMSIGSFLHPCESNLPSSPVLTTRIIRVLPLPRRHSSNPVAETQTCLQALSRFSAYDTLHISHISSDTQKMYFESHIAQTLLTSERGPRSNIAFITNILQMRCRKNEIVIVSFRRNVFRVKGQKGAKRPNEFFEANQLEASACRQSPSPKLTKKENFVKVGPVSVC